MDITPKFLLLVDEITEKLKKQQNDFENSENQQAELILLPNKKRILPKAKRLKMTRNLPKDQFEMRAKEIAENITRLREYLAENRSAYIDVPNIAGYYPKSFESGDTCDLHLDGGFTDLARDKIDAGANTFIRETNFLIAKLKADIEQSTKSTATNATSAARIQHLEYVYDILEKYLGTTCQSYAKQKAIRFQKEQELKKLSKLEPNVKSSTVSFIPVYDHTERSNSSTRLISAASRTRHVHNTKTSFTDEDQPNINGDITLSPEELQVYEQENEAMYQDLVSLRDNIQQIETKVVKTSQLQEFFARIVLQQKDDIDLIANHAVSSTENMTNANEELRKAIQRNASLRVYILFFLLVMSFTLIFLDWYND